VKMPKISVLVSTFRPGGLDITFAGMRDQTFRDFELILVDRRYERRHQEVINLAAEYGLADKIIHAPEHRRNGKWLSLTAGWNTAIALARNEILLFFQDWCYAPPNWLASHMEYHSKYPGAYIIPPFKKYEEALDVLT